jgi:hypothetical protein
MEFLLADTAARGEPTEDELRRLFEARADHFATPARTSFAQVFVASEKRGGSAADDEARRILAVLAGGRDFAFTELGDPSLLPAEVVAADEREIAGQFGAEFVRAIAELPLDVWRGPIPSAFGLHLVRVTAREQARPRSFDDVRDELVAEWHREREEEAEAAYFAGLLRQYDIRVDDNLRPLLAPALAAVGGAAE